MSEKSPVICHRAFCLPNEHRCDTMNRVNEMIEPIAYIETDFKEKFGIPRQSGQADSLVGRVVFLPKYRDPQALRGIEGFSHLWLLFDFSESHRGDWSPTVRPPRLGGNTRVGVFATRSPFRPNSIGLSSVRLLRMEQTEHEGKVLVVAGVDLLDHTPIYDVKPYIPYFDSHPEAVGGYTDETHTYRLTVQAESSLLDLLPSDKRQAAIECLSCDPRPAYQNDPTRVYKMSFAGFCLSFSVSGNVLTVMQVEKEKEQ